MIYDEGNIFGFDVLLNWKSVPRLFIYRVSILAKNAFEKNNVTLPWIENIYKSYTLNQLRYSSLVSICRYLFE